MVISCFPRRLPRSVNLVLSENGGSARSDPVNVVGLRRCGNTRKERTDLTEKGKSDESIN